MPRLSDSEIAERTRAANRRRSERQRQRLANAGKVALMVWVPADLQKQIVALATAEKSNTSEIATRLLFTALNTPNALSDRDALMMELRNQGKSLRQIAVALAEKGYLTANGKPLSNDTIGNALKRLGLK